MDRKFIFPSLTYYENSKPMLGNHLFEGVETASSVYSLSTAERNGSMVICATITPVSNANGETYPQDSNGTGHANSVEENHQLSIDKDVYSRTLCYQEIPNHERAVLTYALQIRKGGSDPVIFLESYTDAFRDILNREGIIAPKVEL